MSDYIKKGDQFWNEDRSEGYEIIEDIKPGTMVIARQFKALGSAPTPLANHPLPEWVLQILRPGGVKAYKDKAKA